MTVRKYLGIAIMLPILLGGAIVLSGCDTLKDPERREMAIQEAAILGCTGYNKAIPHFTNLNNQNKLDVSERRQVSYARRVIGSEICEKGDEPPKSDVLIKVVVDEGVKQLWTILGKYNITPSTPVPK